MNQRRERNSRVECSLFGFRTGFSRNVSRWNKRAQSVRRNRLDQRFGQLTGVYPLDVVLHRPSFQMGGELLEVVS